MKKVMNQKPKLLTTLSLTLFLASCQNSITPKAGNLPTNNDIIVSTYSDGQVTLKEATEELNKLIVKNDKLKGLTFEKLDANQKEAIVKEIVIKEIARKEALKRNLDKDKDYQEALKNFEAELLKQKLFVTLAKEATDEESLKKSYTELSEKIKGKKDLRVIYIAVASESEAEALYQSLLKSPTSFAAEAKKKSLDKEIGKKGGDVGFVVEDLLPAELVKHLRAIKKGQIAKPIKVSDKWVIAKLEDERPAKIESFEKLKDSLMQNLAQKAVENFASQSFEKAKISILVD